MLLDTVQLTSCVSPQLLGGVAVSFGKRNDGASPDHQHGCITDRLGRKLMLFADFEAKDITR